MHIICTPSSSRHTRAQVGTLDSFIHIWFFGHFQAKPNPVPNPAFSLKPHLPHHNKIALLFLDPTGSFVCSPWSTLRKQENIHSGGICDWS